MRLALLMVAGIGLALAQATLPASDLNRIQVGQVAPDFTLQDAEGRSMSLSDFRGKNVVLVFYRGYW